MKLNEIDNRIGKQKKLIDRLFIKYSTTNSAKDREQLMRVIQQIYPTGEQGIDQSINEYINLLIDEVINKLKA